MSYIILHASLFFINVFLALWSWERTHRTVRVPITLMDVSIGLFNMGVLMVHIGIFAGLVCCAVLALIAAVIFHLYNQSKD